MLGAWLERARNIGWALAHQRAHDARTLLPRPELEALQRRRLRELVEHAKAHSKFYRDLYGTSELELGALPVVTKDMMMASFDDFVTDPRLRLDALLSHVQRVEGDERYQGEFRVMASSGSSGRSAVYVYDRAAWRELVAASLRMGTMGGLAPRLPRRTRIATVAAPNGKHMTFRGGASMDIGLYRTRRFSVLSPLSEIARGLDEYQPDFLFGYPSALARLAEEQLDGRLHIAPRAVTTSSEVRTPEMTERMQRAWGVTPFNCLGLTETGITAMDCVEHRGLHLFEDLCIYEVVDADNRPVPSGHPGAKVLVTNLYNRVQPIIRFEVSDLVTVEDDPCPCGRTLRRIVSLDGRSDDILELPGPSGPVRVFPFTLRSALGKEESVVEYRITQDQAGLTVEVVLGQSAPHDAAARVEQALASALAGEGARATVRVLPVPAIPRETGAGKLKHVRALGRARSDST
ncbi:MAG: phenylacetate--CoA ligase family protein [Myxococcales bacterium]|nr:phenylacetate--CoA ligase family protein [Myxococcales bacterium]